MAYRPEIDGLRALAVVPVVLYHAGVPGFSGGFVGVDVFFVISGFLITSLIWPDIQQGRFSIISFYERRARRILPALFAVMAFSAFVAYRIFLNSDLLDFSNSLMATTAFVSNFYFLADIGYFAAPAGTKPLLHTWSLAIEEQFYIFFPLLLLLLRKYQSERLRPILLQLIVLSFCISAVLAVNQPDKAFYLLHSRAWELLVGAVLALGVLPSFRDQRLGSVLAFTGISLILVSVFGYGHATPFPGFAALVPCLGTLLFIWSNTQQRNSVGRVLALKPVVGIGLISYSLYLWHWPLIVFAKYYLVRSLSAVETATIIVVSFLLAFASWRFIERPFRGRSSVISGVEVFRGASVGMLALVLFGFLGNQTVGFSSRPTMAMLDDSKHVDTRRCFSGDNLIRLERGNLCTLGIRREGKPDFILWGDSHANALFPEFKKLAEKSGSYGVFIGEAGCRPLLGIERRDGNYHCREFNRKVFDYVVREQIANVFLVGRWELALGVSSYEESVGARQVFFSDDDSTSLSIEENLAVFQRAFHNTVANLAAANRKVWVVLSPPEPGVRIPQLLAHGRLGSGMMQERLVMDEGITRQNAMRRVLAAAAGEYPVTFLDPLKKLCLEKACLIAANGHNLYRDHYHLSEAGAYFLEGLFTPAFMTIQPGNQLGHPQRKSAHE